MDPGANREFSAQTDRTRGIAAFIEFGTTYQITLTRQRLPTATAPCFRGASGALTA
jgi:hypothetical protein